MYSHAHTHMNMHCTAGGERKQKPYDGARRGDGNEALNARRPHAAVRRAA